MHQEAQRNHDRLSTIGSMKDKPGGQPLETSFSCHEHPGSTRTIVRDHVPSGSIASEGIDSQRYGVLASGQGGTGCSSLISEL